MELNNMNIKIMIASHKKCDVPADPMYLPVFVGSKGKEDNGFTRDDSGDNISEKNPLYCELTGLYWCWKHLDCDYLGLVHYRRYFTLKNRIWQKRHDPMEYVLSSSEAAELLNKYMIIVPKKRKYYGIETIYSHYDHTFDGKQFDAARTVLEDKYPEYVSTFDEYMRSTSGYMFNMFIMPKGLADEYCTWLFDVLAELENRYDTTGMTDFEKRYIGRVAERLFDTWLMHQVKTGKISQRMIHEVPYLYMGNVNWPKKIGGFIQAKLFHKKYQQSF